MEQETQQKLEERVEIPQPESIPSDTITILPLEEYVGRFSARYKKEETFRTIVHEYLGIGRWSKLKLSLSKVFSRSRHEKKIDSLIHTYAKKVRDELMVAVEVKKELESLKPVEQQVEEKKAIVQEMTVSQQQIEWEYQQALAEETTLKEQAERAFQENVVKEQVRVAEARVVIEQKTNAQELVKAKLKEALVKSPLVKVDEQGVLRFDEQKMVSRLEDMFLNEIVEGIERDDGTGFLAKTKVAFGGLIAYWAGIEDLCELPHVDWVQSAILSRTKGYKVPTFPYLIAGKGEERGRASVTTAATFDTSGSMRDNNRLVIAQKTMLATVALMRKLNSNNKTYSSHFNNDVHEVTSKEILQLRAEGGTSTDAALNWLYKKLKDEGPSIAYLITDGEPSVPIASVEKAATKFRDSAIMLRIFLIDGNKGTEDIIRRVGRAAGPRTKVVPVKNYELGGGVMRDISSVFREMYDIDKF